MRAAAPRHAASAKPPAGASEANASFNKCRVLCLRALSHLSPQVFRNMAQLICNIYNSRIRYRSFFVFQNFRNVQANVQTVENCEITGMMYSSYRSKKPQMSVGIRHDIHQTFRQSKAGDKLRPTALSLKGHSQIQDSVDYFFGRLGGHLPENMGPSETSRLPNLTFARDD